MTDAPSDTSEVAGLFPGLPDGAAGLVALLQAGGPVVLILLGLSLAALTIILAKLWQFAAARIADRRPARDALRLYRDGRIADALDIVEWSRDPLAAVLACALRGRRRELPPALIREECVRYGNDILAVLRSWLRPLEVIAALAPLLGLFGTVLGMIEAFQELEQAGNQVDPAVLSGGIWQALLTTAVGLAVAIPVVAALNWLERMVERLAHDMENVVTQVFTEDLSAPVIERPTRAASPRPAAAVAHD